MMQIKKTKKRRVIAILLGATLLLTGYSPALAVAGKAAESNSLQDQIEVNEVASELLEKSAYALNELSEVSMGSPLNEVAREQLGKSADTKLFPPVLELQLLKNGATEDASVSFENTDGLTINEIGYFWTYDSETTDVFTMSEMKAFHTIHKLAKYPCTIEHQDASLLTVKAYVVFEDKFVAYTEPITKSLLDTYQLDMKKTSMDATKMGVLNFTSLNTRGAYLRDIDTHQDTMTKDEMIRLQTATPDPLLTLVPVKIGTHSMTVQGELTEHQGCTVNGFGFVWSYSNPSPVMEDGKYDGFMDASKNGTPGSFTGNIDWEGHDTVYVAAYLVYNDGFIVFSGVQQPNMQDEIISGSPQRSRSADNLKVGKTQYTKTDKDYQKFSTGIWSGKIFYTNTFNNNIVTSDNYTEVDNIYLCIRGYVYGWPDIFINGTNVGTLGDGDANHAYVIKLPRHILKEGENSIYVKGTRRAWSYEVNIGHIQLVTNNGPMKETKMLRTNVNSFTFDDGSLLYPSEKTYIDFEDYYTTGSGANNYALNNSVSMDFAANYSDTTIRPVPANNVGSVKYTQKYMNKWTLNNVDEGMFHNYAFLAKQAGSNDSFLVDSINDQEFYVFKEGKPANYTLEYTLNPYKWTNQSVTIRYRAKKSFTSLSPTLEYVKDPNRNQYSGQDWIDFKVEKNGEYEFLIKEKNLSKEYRIVVRVDNIDTQKPTVALKGASDVSLVVGEKYTDLGVEAADNRSVGSEIAESHVFSGGFDPTNPKEGKYVETYTVKDLAGNESTIKRNIEVFDKALTVTTGICSISATNRTLRGQVLYTGGKVIAERGFAFSFYQFPSIESNETLYKDTTLTTANVRQEFTKVISTTNLIEGVTYNYRAYAKAVDGTVVYGENQTLSTDAKQYGNYTITASSSSISDSVTTASFKIARTGGSDGAQTVYYRVLPLSAMPGLSLLSSSINFAQGETSKNISITIPRTYDDYSYQNRQFATQLYKVTGGATYTTTPAIVSQNKGYIMDSSYFSSGSRTKTLITNTAVTVNDTTSKVFSSCNFTAVSGYQGHSYGVSYAISSSDVPSIYLNGGYNVKQITGGTFGTQEINDGYQMLAIHKENNSGTGHTIIYECQTENYQGGKGGYYLMTMASGALSEKGTKNFPGSLDSDGNFHVVASAAGSGADDWLLNNLSVNYNVYDGTRPWPTELVVNNSAQYKAGDVIYLSARFNEMVQVSGGVPSITANGMTFNYDGGAGTDALYFKGIVPSGVNFTSISNPTINGSSYIRDYAGNSCNSIYISDSENIAVDTAAPAISASMTTSGIQTRHTASVNSITGSDGKFDYIWSAESNVSRIGSGWKTYNGTAATLTTAGGNGNYYLHIRSADPIGNIGYKTIGPITLDNIAPTITLTPNGNTEFQQPPMVKIVASDTHLSVLKYFLSTSPNPNIDWSRQGTVISSGTNVRVEAGNNLAIYLLVYAKDTVGNETMLTSNLFKIDNLPPVFSTNDGDTAKTECHLDTSDVVHPKLILTAHRVMDEGSGMSKVTATITNSKNASQTIELTKSGESYSKDFLITSFGNYAQDSFKITYTAYDLVGNRTTLTESANVIYDTIKPVIHIQPKSGQNLTDWTRSPITVMVIAEKNGTLNPLKSLELPDNILIEDNSPGDLDTTVGVIKCAFTAQDNGTVSFKATDAADNVIKEVYNITNIDIEAPRMSYTTTPNVFTKENVVVSVELYDDLTIVKKEDGSTVETGAGGILFRLDNDKYFSAYDGAPITFTVKENGIHLLQVKDALGNTKNYEININNIDKNPPVVTADNTNFGISHNDITVKLTYSDQEEGKPSIRRYAVTQTAVTPSSWTEFNGEPILLTNPSVTQKAFYIHYYSEDAVGNVVQGFFGPYTIDKSAPLISIISPTSEQYQKGHTATILMDKTGSAESGNGAPIVQYVWTSSAVQPADSSFTKAVPTTPKAQNFFMGLFSSFMSIFGGNSVGDQEYTGTLEEKSGDGTRYLHLMVTFASGSGKYYVKSPFKFDNTPPSIKLRGDSPQTIRQNTSYVEYGADISDAIDKYPVLTVNMNKFQRMEIVNGKEIPVLNIDKVNTAEDGLTDNVVAYTVSDQAGNTATVERTIYVVQNTKLEVSCNEDTLLSFLKIGFQNVSSNLLSNVTITSLPQNGALKLGNTAVNSGQVIPITSLDSLTYMPNANWNGETSFSWNWATSDGANGANETVIRVNEVNDLPEFVDPSKNSASMTVDDIYGKPIEIDLSSLVTDIDGDTLTIQSFGKPTNGILTSKGLKLYYTPSAQYQGTMTVICEISDGQAALSIPVTITVTDKTAPIIQVEYRADSDGNGEIDWSYPPVAVVFTVEDIYAGTQKNPGVGVNTVSYKRKGATDSTYQNISAGTNGKYQFTVMENAEITIRAIDKNGNIQTTDVLVTNVDTTVTITTRHISKTEPGKLGTEVEISGTTTQEIDYGIAYTTTPIASIKGYTLKASPSNASGKGTDNIIVTYEYERIKHDVILYYEDGSGQSLQASKKMGENYWGTVISITPDQALTIEGIAYQYVGMKNGNALEKTEPFQITYDKDGNTEVYLIYAPKENILSISIPISMNFQVVTNTVDQIPSFASANMGYSIVNRGAAVDVTLKSIMAKSGNQLQIAEVVENNGTYEIDLNMINFSGEAMPLHSIPPDGIYLGNLKDGYLSPHSTGHLKLAAKNFDKGNDFKSTQTISADFTFALEFSLSKKREVDS